MLDERATHTIVITGLDPVMHPKEFSRKRWIAG